jgi:hypothetical protein
MACRRAISSVRDWSVSLKSQLLDFSRARRQHWTLHGVVNFDRRVDAHLFEYGK